jgi:hypothetical protein
MNVPPENDVSKIEDDPLCAVGFEWSEPFEWMMNQHEPDIAFLKLFTWFFETPDAHLKSALIVRPTLRQKRGVD